MSVYSRTIYPVSGEGYAHKLCHYLYNRYLPTGRKLLDIGCGKGDHMIAFAGLGMDSDGVDLLGDYGDQCDVSKDVFPYDCDTFDMIFSKSLLEHIGNPDHMLQEAKRVLKPGGIMVLMTPDWNSHHTHFWDDYTHQHPYTPKSLRDCITINGFDNAHSELFYQLPWLWSQPWLRWVPPLVTACTTDGMKWKNNEQRNGQDRKLIRFSREQMILASGVKP